MSEAPPIIDPDVQANESLDPTDWAGFRAQAHLMLDDMLGYIEKIRERPVWQPIPAEVRARFRTPAPRQTQELATVYAEFMRDMLPFAQGSAVKPVPSMKRAFCPENLAEARLHPPASKASDHFGDPADAKDRSGQLQC